MKLRTRNNTDHFRMKIGPFDQLHRPGRAAQVILIFTAAVVLSACAATQKTDRPWVVNKRLQIERQNGRKLKCEKLEGDTSEILQRYEGRIKKHTLDVDRKGSVGRYKEKIERILKAYVDYREGPGKQFPNNKILIYVNGGLNRKEVVNKQAVEQIPCMKDAGYFPIFLIWRTGPFETYFEQIGEVRNGYLRKNVQPTWPFYLIGDIGEGVTRFPVTYYNQLGRYLDPIWNKNKYSLENYKPNSKNVAKTLYDKEMKFDKPHVDMGKFALYWLAIPLRVPIIPFLDALGQTAWENMVRRAQTTVNAAFEFQRESLDENSKKKLDEDLKRYKKGTGGFSRFFQDLAWCIRGAKKCLHFPDDSPEDKKRREALRELLKAKLKQVKLTIVGHSMGTIVLNELISRYEELPYENIVYMGAAASIGDVKKSLVPILQRDKNKRKELDIIIDRIRDIKRLTETHSTIQRHLEREITELNEKIKSEPKKETITIRMIKKEELDDAISNQKIYKAELKKNMPKKNLLEEAIEDLKT